MDSRLGTERSRVARTSGSRSGTEQKRAAQPPGSRAALLALGAAGALGTLAFTYSPGSAPQNKVLLIGIDGIRPDVLAEVDTPSLDALIADGAYSDRALTTRPTVSGPAWSSMLTGVWPEKHGVLSNDFTSNRYGEYPDFLTRIEAARPELETYAVADWLPLVTETAGGPLIGSAPDRVVALNGYELGWAEADAHAVDSAIVALGDPDLDALFVYLGDPDETSHRAASIGEPYREAIRRADALVGRLVAAVRGRVTYPTEDWLILVSTDHGRRPDGGHGGDTPEETTIFLLAHGPSVSGARIEGEPRIVDVAVTALVHLGIEIDPAWGLDGVSVGIGAGTREAASR